MKAFLLKIYNKLYDFRLWLIQSFYTFINFFVNIFFTPPHVMGIDETMNKIIDENLSISRFGDGEIKLVNKTDISFQKASDELSKRLKEVLKADEEGFLPCILSYFKYSDELTDEVNAHWKKHMNRFRYVWYKNTDKNINYGHSFVSRFYMEIRDKSTAPARFQKMKQIWDNKDVIIVEGEKSRLGIGNDLFNNVKSIRRILCPVDNAYRKYNEILEAAKKHGNSDILFLIAIGPSATVLAYDLFKSGFRAIDLGHLDIEYEWCLAGATKKQPVKNKYVNEAGAGMGVKELDDKKYHSEIIETII